MATLCYVITIIIMMLVNDSYQDSNSTVSAPLIGTDCLGKDFICVDAKHFLICVDLQNRFQTVSQDLQICSGQLYCDNALNYECASNKVPVAVNVTSEPSTTTIHSVVDDETVPPKEVEIVVVVSETTTFETKASTVPDSTTTETTIGLVVNETTTSKFDGSSVDSTSVPPPTESTTLLSSDSPAIIETTSQNNDTPGSESTLGVTAVVPEENSTAQSSTALSNPSTWSAGTTTTATPTTSTPGSESTLGVTAVVPEENSTAQSSTAPSNPSTWSAGTTTTATPTTSTSKFTCTNSGRFPHPADCHKFIYCLQFSRYYHRIDITCPFGGAFDPETKSCSSETTRICSGATKFICQKAGYFKANDSTVKYYICVPNLNDGFIKLEFSCPSHFMFMANAKRCRLIRADSAENSDDLRVGLFDRENHSGEDSYESRDFQSKKHKKHYKNDSSSDSSNES